jgi:hypothetical protein
MATRQDTRRGSVGPIIFVVAFLAVLALGLSGWYVMTSGPTSHPGRVITTSFPGPDATERNQQLQYAREKNPEATHGH